MSVLRVYRDDTRKEKHLMYVLQVDGMHVAQWLLYYTVVFVDKQAIYLLAPSHTVELDNACA